MALTATPMSKMELRDAAVAELLSTEAAYVSDMKLLVDVFVLPLERWAADMQAARDAGVGHEDSVVPDLSQQDCTTIFANAKQLANFNRQFLVDLRRAHGGPAPSGHGVVVSPVFRDSGNWRRITGGSEKGDLNDGLGVVSGTTAVLSTSSSFAQASVDSKLAGDPFKRPTPADADEGPRQMLEVFLKSAPFLKMYSLYVNNFEAATERLTALERDNPSFAAFLTACERQKPCRGLRLRDFLILPVQRIPRYRLLLETILRHTAIESTMHSKVEESLSAMGGIASKINADVTLQQQKNRVYELQLEFGGAQFVTASRLFIREGDLFKVARNGMEKLHFVLFNDLLVYGQAKRRRGVLGVSGRSKQLYHHRREINLSRCFVVDAPSYGSRSPSFLGETGMLVVSEVKSFMVMASTPVEKDAWLQAIRLCMRDLSDKAEAREILCRSQDYDGDIPRSPISSMSRLSRWSMGSTHGPLVASAPRSVWVPGKDGQKSLRLVDFSLPMWAGDRTSCGCLSHTELTWGKEGLAVSGGASMAGALAAALGNEAARHEMDAIESKIKSRGVPQPIGDLPRQVSCMVTMKPSERMGLRLRDLHPGCGGGVVVVGFESKAAGKRAGIKQGDRIVRVEDLAVGKTSDIIWALSQAPADPSDGAGRSVLLTLLRGFPKSDRPWLPPLDPSPAPTLLSPPSSAVESRSDDDFSPLAVLSAPGSRTFSGNFSSANRPGFGGESCGAKANGVSGSFADAVGLGEGSPLLGSMGMLEAAPPSPAAKVQLSIAPPSPEDKVELEVPLEVPVDLSGDLSGSGHGTGDSADSSAGRAKGPAPPQANVNAGGDPAKPFSAHNRKLSHQGRLAPGSLGAGVGIALEACWACRADDRSTMSDDENSRPTVYKPEEASAAVAADNDRPTSKPIEKLRSAAVGSCVGVAAADEGEGGEDEFQDTRSNDSGSSDASSLFLTAVSPSRIPPPLVSIASSMPAPPVSMTSSVVSGSFSNFSPGRTWYSPPASTSASAEATDTSMSWLKPLPPPPPRKNLSEGQEGWESFTSAPTHTPPPPGGSSRDGTGLVYPSGRWVQTPPLGTPRLGEPKNSPDAGNAGMATLEDPRRS